MTISILFRQEEAAIRRYELVKQIHMANFRFFYLDPGTTCHPERQRGIPLFKSHFDFIRDSRY
jgi:hypothetical protein